VNVLVDTPVWSISFRRRPQDLNADEVRLKDAVGELAREGRALLIGPVRQELLSGLREQSQFNRMLRILQPFQDADIKTDDYENAARMSNLCTSRGVANTSVDMLICAVAVASGASILTTDRDFLRYVRVLPIQLFQAA
jgi:predicted nucleic acid-binding protein